MIHRKEAPKSLGVGSPAHQWPRGPGPIAGGPSRAEVQSCSS